MALAIARHGRPRFLCFRSDHTLCLRVCPRHWTDIDLTTFLLCQDLARLVLAVTKEDIYYTTALYVCKAKQCAARIVF